MIMCLVAKHRTHVSTMRNVRVEGHLALLRQRTNHAVTAGASSDRWSLCVLKIPQKLHLNSLRSRGCRYGLRACRALSMKLRLRIEQRRLNFQVLSFT